ncbi:hypothetical protein PR202_ga14913 [Eleusine coracana subsp. coracana]|uniref:Cellulose synthase n=1 Tax=Eleusine coracana subsp. coracana TaxID=191504 RepID=A0AAV5CIP8_ELECO|nr:hypothetical protein PR202_ga14913 [Eleusine coracana subsp. coracana]
MDAGGLGFLVAGSRREFVVLNVDEFAKSHYSKSLPKAVRTTSVRYAEMMLIYYKKRMSILLPATSVLSLYAALAMSMSVRRALKHALDARPVTSATKVCSPRVHGDEEEEGSDDIESEFASSTAGRSNLVHPYRSSVAESSMTSWDIDSISVTNSGASVHCYEEHVGTPTNHHALELCTPALEKSYDIILSNLSVFSVVLAQARPINPKRDVALYGYGSVAWKNRVEWKRKQQQKMQNISSDGEGSDLNDFDSDHDTPRCAESKQQLSRKLPIPSSKINPYRIVIILRLAILALFIHYRILNPVHNAYGLWLTSVICEIWYEKEGQKSELAPIDIFVSTVDPMKEPPLVTANTVLSILAVDYPVDKVSCYVSDDGAAMLTFDALTETCLFARKWVPFCKNYKIEPRAPEWYFAQKIDYLREKVHPDFVRERRAMKREYEEFKVRINAIVANSRKVPEGGWSLPEGGPWLGNNVQDHAGMVQVITGHDFVMDDAGNRLPWLVYVSREKRPGYDHHKKAGALNALVVYSVIHSFFFYEDHSYEAVLPAFKGSAPINLSDRLHQVLRWALGSVEIFLSSHCPLWWCLSHLFALFQGLLKVLGGVDTKFTVTLKGADDSEFSELYEFKWTWLLVPPTILILINVVGVLAGVSNAITVGYESWGPLLGKLFFAFWVLLHLYPFLKGVMGKQERVPTLVVVLSVVLAAIFSLLWVRVDPFTAKFDGPVLEVCGLE